MSKDVGFVFETESHVAQAVRYGAKDGLEFLPLLSATGAHHPGLVYALWGLEPRALLSLVHQDSPDPAPEDACSPLRFIPLIPRNTLFS